MSPREAKTVDPTQRLLLCKTFANNEDEYCRGEGVGVIVLKRLDDAIADDDNIQAVIRAIATNHSAHTASITHPHSLTQQALYKRVLEKALVKANSVQYIEMYGTGTQAGDTTEVESATSVFGQHRKSPLYMALPKPMLAMAREYVIIDKPRGAVTDDKGQVAGITSLIRSILMLQHQNIPPHPCAEAGNFRHCIKIIFIFLGSPCLFTHMTRIEEEN